ncbi:TonB-dependent receptor [uncultured Bacteroides sp.]|uniref:TonB-dependent receptor n=1 Tax=uncultured Bacteroides sp. TaxID=162156 RepID=UPI002AA8BC63|nr:TonB-dependent receptor [uncultured Bacteroides sp.]
MKKIITLAAFALLIAGSAGAQTVYDAAKLTDKDLNGTARFVGMGGAMGALGGDISTIGTNPAGIGIYRSNDVMGTMGFSTMGTESSYDGKTVNSDRNRFTFDNVGIVFSTKIGNETPLRYVNFGFNYHRSKSFYKNMSMEGLMNTGPAPDNLILSQVNQISSQANHTTSELGDADSFLDNNVGWLSALGWQGYLIDKDGNGYKPILPNVPYSNFFSKESGGIDEYDFNVALNLNDRAYLGLTIGAYDVNYSKYSSYDEDYGNGEGYNLQSWNNISGSGFDIKLGAIVRPFEELPLRIGAAIHTPTFYKLTLATSARLESDVFLNDEATTTPVNVDTYDALDNRDMSRDFDLQTPWKYNLSLGYTVGNNLALGAEYEYEDYSSMKFRDPDNGSSWFDYENSTVKDMTKGVSTFRIGAEYKVVPEFAFRLGYNHIAAALKTDAYKDLPYNSINTDTDFANAASSNNYTVGIGYRGNVFYSDLAYQYSTYKEDFYPFDELYLNPTKVTNTRSQVLLTLGMRF